MTEFWDQVAVGAPDECWEWTRGRFTEGYGSVRDGPRHRGAHRVAWRLTHGPIPSGLCVLHSCDNPPCCNPAHLFLGTNAENVADRDRKGRQPHVRQLGERNGKARLTRADVIAIRALSPQGTPQKVIAARYAVSASHISDIVRGRKWPPEALGGTDA